MFWRKNEEGVFEQVGRYRTDHLLTLADVLHARLDYSEFVKLKGKHRGRFWREYGCASKAELARRVAQRFLRKMAEHLIATNDVYLFPTRERMIIRITRKKPGKEASHFLHSAKGIAFREVDIYAAEGIYQMTLEFSQYGRHRSFLVKLPKHYYLRIVDQANKGRVYFDPFYHER